MWGTKSGAFTGRKKMQPVGTHERGVLPVELPVARQAEPLHQPLEQITNEDVVGRLVKP